VGQLYNGAKRQLAKLDPALVPLKDGMMLTIAFVPNSAISSIPPPPQSTITSLQTILAQAQSSSSTSTPSLGTTPPTTKK
jgi:hypothetical protein